MLIVVALLAVTVVVAITAGSNNMAQNTTQPTATSSGGQSTTSSEVTDSANKDANTQTVADNNCNFDITKRDGRIVFNGHETPALDTDTFELINCTFAKDKDSLYELNRTEIMTLDGIAPSGVRKLSESPDVIVNNEAAYYISYPSRYKPEPKAIAGINPRKLRLVTENPKVFSDGTRVFALVNRGTGPAFLDSELSGNIQLVGRLTTDPDAAVFRDNQSVYVLTDDRLKPTWSTYALGGETKVLENSGYFVNGDKIYYATSSLPDAKPNSFAVVYDESKSITGDDDGRKTDPYQVNYAKDNNDVYYEGKTVTGADPESFQTYPASYYQEYARDADDVYLDGEVIAGADPDNFTVLKRQPYEGCAPGNFGKDNTAVYYKTDVVNGANPDTFEAIFFDYGKDNNSGYVGTSTATTSLENFNPTCDYG